MFSEARANPVSKVRYVFKSKHTKAIGVPGKTAKETIIYHQDYYLYHEVSQTSLQKLVH